MKTVIKLSLLLLLFNVELSKSNDKVDKLKIGIKKRIEDCTQKSRKGDLLYIDYTGTLTDGTVFDSSIGKKPLTFTLGAGQVIKGWDSGILGMCSGEVRKLQIPPELAYGNTAVGKIPKNSVLIFEVELIKIERKDEF